MRGLTPRNLWALVRAAVVVTCVAAMASAEDSKLGSGTSDDATRKWGLVNEVRRMLRTYEMPSDPVSWYQRTKAKFSASDAEIVDALLGQISQDGVPAGRKDGVVARRAAEIGLNLFRGDQELEEVVLDACLNPSRFDPHGRELRLSPVIPAVVRFGSEELVSEVRKLVEKSGDVAMFDKKVSMRPSHKRVPLVTDEATGTGLQSSLRVRFKPDAWRPERNSHPQESGAHRAVLSTWLPVSLGITGLLAFCWGWIRRARAHG